MGGLGLADCAERFQSNHRKKTSLVMSLVMVARTLSTNEAHSTREANVAVAANGGRGRGPLRSTSQASEHVSSIVHAAGLSGRRGECCDDVGTHPCAPMRLATSSTLPRHFPPDARACSRQAQEAAEARSAALADRMNKMMSNPAADPSRRSAANAVSRDSRAG